MRPRICLVRHGQAAPPGILAGQTDLPLLPEGEEQMRRLARRLGRFAFGAAWCSPLLRARHSAAILLAANAAHCAAPLVEPALREISLGQWDGKSTNWIRAAHARVWEERGRNFAHTAPPGGESVADLARRVLPAFAAIARQAEQHAHSLVVAHQAVNRVILASVLGMDFADIRTIAQGPAAVSFLEIGPEGLRLVPHLVQ